MQGLINELLVLGLNQTMNSNYLCALNLVIYCFVTKKKTFYVLKLVKFNKRPASNMYPQ